MGLVHGSSLRVVDWGFCAGLWFLIWVVCMVCLCACLLVGVLSYSTPGFLRSWGLRLGGRGA